MAAGGRRAPPAATSAEPVVSVSSLRDRLSIPAPRSRRRSRRGAKRLPAHGVLRPRRRAEGPRPGGGRTAAAEGGAGRAAAAGPRQVGAGGGQLQAGRGAGPGGAGEGDNGALPQAAGRGDVFRRDHLCGRRGATGAPGGAAGAGAAALRRAGPGAAAPPGVAAGRRGSRGVPALPAVSARPRPAGEAGSSFALPAGRLASALPLLSPSSSFFPVLTPVLKLSHSKQYLHSLPAALAEDFPGTLVIFLCLHPSADSTWLYSPP